MQTADTPRSSTITPRRAFARIAAGAIAAASFAGCDAPRGGAMAANDTGASAQRRTTAEASPRRGSDGSARADASDRRTPVLIELFSSEGCSSCPPADDVMRALDETQPIDSALVVPLELHVDYWNDLGWADPFSSSRWSERQNDYSVAGGRRGVFTPEAIVDGRRSIVGSDRDGVEALVRDAASRPHVGVSIEVHGKAVRVTVAEHDDADAALFVAVTEGGLTSEVRSGENAGRTLRHAPVVRRLDRVSDASSGVHALALSEEDLGRANASIVAFVQSNHDRAVLGTAIAPL